MKSIKIDGCVAEFKKFLSALKQVYGENAKLKEIGKEMGDKVYVHLPKLRSSTT